MLLRLPFLHRSSPLISCAMFVKFYNVEKRKKSRLSIMSECRKSRTKLVALNNGQSDLGLETEAPLIGPQPSISPKEGPKFNLVPRVLSFPSPLSLQGTGRRGPWERDWPKLKAKSSQRSLRSFCTAKTLAEYSTERPLD